MRIRCLTAIAALCVAVTVHAQQDQSRITTVPVAGPVQMLQGGGGNVAVMADPAGALMIDAMYERNAEQIREAIKSLPGGDHVRILVNTHWHADHTGGNAALGSGAIIIAQENVRACLAVDQTVMGRTVKALSPNALPP